MSGPASARRINAPSAPNTARNGSAAPVAPMPKAERLGISGVRTAAIEQMRAGANSNNAVVKQSPRVANPRAAAGMLRALDHVAEVRLSPPPQPHAPFNDPLLSALRDGPAMPAFPTHGPEPLQMREVERRAAFEGGVVTGSGPEELHLREVARRAAFEGGSIHGSGPATLPADPARREAFEGGAPINGEEAQQSQASAAASAAIADTQINIAQPATAESTDEAASTQTTEQSSSASDLSPQTSADEQRDVASDQPPSTVDTTATTASEADAAKKTTEEAKAKLEAEAKEKAAQEEEVAAEAAKAAEMADRQAAEQRAAREAALALEVEQAKAAQAAERAAAAVATDRAREEAEAAALEAQRVKATKDAAITAEVAAERARIDAEREERAEADRRAKQVLEDAETARQLAECEAQLAAAAERRRLAAVEAEVKAAADAEAARLAAEAERQRVEAERIRREREDHERMEQELAATEAARLAALAAHQDRIAAEQAQAEEQLRAALAAETARLESEASQKARELAEASRYIFRAEALPNSFCDFDVKLSCRFDPKPFQTTALQAAFGVNGNGGGGGGAGGNGKRGSGGAGVVGSLLSSSTSLRPYVELLSLRSHRSMVSKAVWSQILAGEAETLRPGQSKNENVVRVGENVWIVADRAQGERVRVSLAPSPAAPSSSSLSPPASHTHQVEFEVKDVLSRIESLCHNEYLRPVLIRVLSRRPEHASSAGASAADGGPVLLGEVMTTLRELESSVVGNKPSNDPNGPVRTVEAPFPLTLPAASAAAAAAAGAATPAVVGSCLVTRAQELVHQPFGKLLESMESKRSKKKSSSSSGLLFPRRCKMQVNLSCNHLAVDSGPLHVCGVFYRAEKEGEGGKEAGAEDVEEEDAEEEGTDGAGQAAASASSSKRSSATPAPLSRVWYNNKVWVEYSRSNAVSFDEHPSFERVALELDEAHRKAKTALMVLVFNAAYLGGSIGSSSGVEAEGIDLDRCALIGGCTTTLLQMCAASGTVSAATSTPGRGGGGGAARTIVDATKKRSKGKRGSDGVDLALGGVMSVSLDDLDSDVRMLHRSSPGSTDLLASAVTLARMDGGAHAALSGQASPSLTLSRVSLFVPSTQLEDVERATAKRARQLAKLAEAARAAQEHAEKERGRCELQRQQVRAEMVHMRAEMEAALRSRHLQQQQQA